MPRIDTDLKLDFKDVLFRPKRSTIRSRADVSVSSSLLKCLNCLELCEIKIEGDGCVRCWTFDREVILLVRSLSSGYYLDG